MESALTSATRLLAAEIGLVNETTTDPVMDPVTDEGLCPHGMWLPLFGDAELRLPKVVLIVLYGLGLFWSFLAVGIVADVFMAGIETITSQTKSITGPDGKKYDVKVRRATRE